jgi:oligoribonuclease NrnB/cAMP/cGMP phosphodiesterase (DHH superfamily)
MKVIYHASCIDGYTAAWCAWLKFGKDAEYIAAQYGDAPPDCAGEDVLIVDFSYPREALLAIKETAKSLGVLDHHKTAQADLEGLDFCVFDMERSGAGIAWDYLLGRGTRPALVDYVEDRDLWRFALPGSKEINAWIASWDRDDFQAWSLLRRDLETDKPDCFAQGATLLRALAKQVASQGELASMVDFAGHRVPVLNCTYAISETIGALAEAHPFAVGWFERTDGKTVYSLRSRGDFDVSAIAKTFGGGGHKNAAGFTVDKPIHRPP